MKRLVSVMLAALLLATAFAGCGKSEKREKVLYNEIKFGDCIELLDYKNITVDTSSEEYDETYTSLIESDIVNYDLYVKKTEGTVAEGDVANIDYVGKKDDVAFDGGTAEGYDLEIGSGSFIDGFEDGLIGVEIGSTVDLNLTFPDGYQNEELSGADVVFTVTVNYVKTDESLNPEEYYKDLGYEALEDYEANVSLRAVNELITEQITSESVVEKYPDADVELLTTEVTELFENSIMSMYGVDLDTYLTANSMTQDDFKESLLEEQIKPLIDETMPFYAILDAEKIEVTDEDVDAQVELIKKQYDQMYGDSSVTAEQLTEYYGEYYFEGLAVTDKALEKVKALNNIE